MILDELADIHLGVEHALYRIQTLYALLNVRIGVVVLLIWGLAVRVSRVTPYPIFKQVGIEEGALQ